MGIFAESDEEWHLPEYSSQLVGSDISAHWNAYRGSGCITRADRLHTETYSNVSMFLGHFFYYKLNNLWIFCDLNL